MFLWVFFDEQESSSGGSQHPRDAVDTDAAMHRGSLSTTSAMSITFTISAEIINCCQVSKLYLSLHQSTGQGSGGTVCRPKVKHMETHFLDGKITSTEVLLFYSTDILLSWTENVNFLYLS